MKSWGGDKQIEVLRWRKGWGRDHERGDLRPGNGREMKVGGGGEIFKDVGGFGRRDIEGLGVCWGGKR